MTLLLAKHLVERGLVSPSEMDDALQRQVVYGGSVDTNLLELGLLSEEVLTLALSEIHKLQVATAGLLEQRDPRINNLFPARLAEKYQVIPVVMSGRAVHALAASRVHPLVAEEIGFMLSLTVRIHLVCEARLQGLLRDWLGVEIEPRFEAIIDRLGPYELQALDVEPKVPPGATSGDFLAAHAAHTAQPPEARDKIERVLTDVEVDTRAEDSRRERARRGRITLHESVQACMEANHRDDIVDVTMRFARQFMPFVGLFIINDDLILGWDAVGSPEARERIKKVHVPTGISTVLSMVTQTNAYYLGPIPETVGNNELLEALERKKPRNVLVIPIPVQKRLVGLLYGDAGIRSIRGGMIGDLLVFASRLSSAFEQLILRKKREAQERLSRSSAAGETKTGVPSVFEQEVPVQLPDSEPREVPEPTPSREEEAHAQPAADEPVVVDETFVDTSSEAPVTDADQPGFPQVQAGEDDDLQPGEERVQFEDLTGEDQGTISVIDDETEVVVVDTETAFVPALDAPLTPTVIPLGQPKEAGVPDRETESQLEPAQPEHVPEPPDLTPAEVAPPVLTAIDAIPLQAELPPVPEQTPSITDLVEELVCGEPELMSHACDALSCTGVDAVEAVMARFPGLLVFDVRGSHDSVPPLSEHSELLRCVLELGVDACEAVAGRLEDREPRTRYYAVRVLGETYCPRYVPRLAMRLYDRDALIRLTAIDVLQTYRRTPAFHNMLKELRAKLRSPEPNQQAIAAALLGNFKDVDALALLAGLVKAPQKMVARAAVESLSFITKQDFKNSERKWLKWWKAHKGERRIQWLIAGLRSKNRDIRFSSAQELNQITHEYFGYYFDSGKDDREKAVQQWEMWWKEKGRRIHFDD